MPLVVVDKNPSDKALRTFGIAALVAFGALGAVCFFRGGLPFWKFPGAAKSVAAILWTVGGVAGLCAFVAPKANRLLYLGLTYLTLPIGLVLSFVIVGVLFYGVMTPIGLFFRLIGRDALDRRFDRAATSYWQPCAAPKSVARYFRQF